MSEVLIGIAENLSNPKPITLHDCYTWPEDKFKRTVGISNWNCNCTYCKLLLINTYLNVELHKADRNCEHSKAEDLYHELHKVKNLRTRLENLDMEPDLKGHIKNAKKFIGAEFSHHRYLALKYVQTLDETISKATYFIRKYEDPLVNVRSGPLLFGTQPLKMIDWF